MKRIAKVLIATAIVSAGCEVGPDYHAPQMQVPSQFNATQPATQPSTQPATEAAVPVDLAVWWESFRDPQLNWLIARAVRSNLDVRLAEARVREARALLQFNRAALFPTVDSSASYTRSQQSRNAFAVPRGATSGGTASSSPFSALSGRNNLYQAGFDAGWELDVFGGTRRAIEAASASLQAQVEARRNAMVTLLSEVARNYIALRGAQNQLRIARNNITAQRDTLTLTVSRFTAGIATDLDVAREEAVVASTESQVPTFETQIQQAIHRLGVLLDLDPAALESELTPPAPLPSKTPVVPAGLPSELLRRRPDVRQSERLLAASNANIGVATADLFPKFSLTGALGLESIDLQKFARTDSVLWSFGPSVSWRIFDYGQIWANVHVQEARQQEALIQYRQFVLQSMQDVEDALTAYNNEQSRRRVLARAVESNRRAVDLATKQNTAGIVAFLDVLTAQQSLYQSEDLLAQSEQTVQTNLVALYKALGGGWESTEVADSQ